MAKRVRSKSAKDKATECNTENDLDSEASAVLDLLRVDLRDPEHIKKFRARYPVRASSMGPSEPTDRDLRNARAVADLVGQAILFGSEEAWARIGQAHAVLRKIQSQDQRVEKCVRILWDAVECWHERPDSRPHMSLFVTKDLAFYDDAFGNLTPKRLDQGFAQTKPAALTQKGGKGNIGALALAAELTLECAAFGFSHDPKVESFEHARTRVKTALTNAANRARKTPQRSQGLWVKPPRPT